MKLCTYFLATGIRRPCPAGTGCTVKQKGKRAGAWEYKRDSDWSRRMYEAKAAKNVLRTKVCPHCHKVFQTTVAHQIYCNKKCKDAAANKKYLQRKKDASMWE